MGRIYREGASRAGIADGTAVTMSYLLASVGLSLEGSHP